MFIDCSFMFIRIWIPGGTLLHHVFLVSPTRTCFSFKQEIFCFKENSRPNICLLLFCQLRCHNLDSFIFAVKDFHGSFLVHQHLENPAESKFDLYIGYNFTNSNCFFFNLFFFRLYRFRLFLYRLSCLLLRHSMTKKIFSVHVCSEGKRDIFKLLRVFEFFSA